MQKFFDCGIDLGTTNSCIAYPTEDNKCVIIENNADRMQVTPSVVANVKGRYIIGRRATNYGNAIRCFKRKMGTKEIYKFSGTDVTVSAEELSSEILKSMKHDAEARLEKDVKDVVITVPAAFSSLQNEATKKAAVMAGFRNVVLLQEPIAAAMAYGVRPNAKDQYWMVFDYGGGTLDVSILSTHDGRLRVINSEGDNYCGGSDIDRLIYEKIVMPMLEENDYDVSGNAEVENRVKDLCEPCKIELSSAKESTIEIFDMEDNNGVDIECACTVTRAQFEELITDTVDRCISVAQKAIAGAQVNDENCKIDKILLVGGSTFIPLVREKIKKAFAFEMDCSLNPMTVVAEGAAIYSGTCSADVEDYESKETVADDELNISLQYEPVTSKDFVNVIGTIENAKSKNVNRIKVTSQKDGGWTSGWVDFIDEDNGIFDVDVKIEFVNECNSYKILVSDTQGNEIELPNGKFEIKHNENSLKMSAPPATFSVCVMITDGENNVLLPIIAKNTPLPAEGTKTFHTTKELNPRIKESIDIHIWEGEEFENPDANNWIGCVHIDSSAMPYTIPAGTDIDITIKQDESRTNHFTGYIPSIDYQIPEETLRDEDERISLSDRLEEIESQIQRLEISIKKLSNNDIDIEDLEDEFDELKNEYDNIADYLETDSDKVQLFIKRFYEVHTKIILKEREFSKEQYVSSIEEEIETFENDMNKFGNEDQKRKFNEYKQAHATSQGEDNKKYYYECLNDLHFNTIINNFDWLANFGGFLLGNEDIVYEDDERAEFWKQQMRNSYNSHNTDGLKRAIFELFGLIVSSANDAINAMKADLRL